MGRFDHVRWLCIDVNMMIYSAREATRPDQMPLEPSISRALISNPDKQLLTTSGIARHGSVASEIRGHMTGTGLAFLSSYTNAHGARLNVIHSASSMP